MSKREEGINKTVEIKVEKSRTVKLRDFLAETVYPSGIKCVVCDSELHTDTRYGLCSRCRLSYNTSFCRSCGRPIAEDNPFCYDCRDHADWFDAARSPLVFEGDVRDLLHRFKYGNARYLATVFAEFMTDTFFEAQFAPDFILFVPIHVRRRRRRGYNQAQLLALELAQRVHLPVLDILEKTVHTKNLARLNRKRRSERIADTFRLTDKAAVCGKTVLLIDDVMTTGATANECAKTLKDGGCETVLVLTFASVHAPVALDFNKTGSTKNSGTEKLSKKLLKKLKIR